MPDKWAAHGLPGGALQAACRTESSGRGSSRKFCVGVKLEQPRVILGSIYVASQVGIVEVDSFDGLGVCPQVLRATHVAFLDHQRRKQRTSDEHWHSAYTASFRHGRWAATDLLPNTLPTLRAFHILK